MSQMRGRISAVGPGHAERLPKVYYTVHWKPAIDPNYQRSVQGRLKIMKAAFLLIHTGANKRIKERLPPLMDFLTHGIKMVIIFMNMFIFKNDGRR
jgi:hypothetical protein